ncbi:MAG: peptidoglycan-binding domain-containing protein [bacterium]
MVKKLTFALFLFFVCALFVPQSAFAGTLPTWKLHETPTYTKSSGVNGWAGSVWAATAPNGSGGSGLFVTVGSYGNIMTSPDGLTWTIQSSIGGGWNQVDWSPSLHLFVAVGHDGVHNGYATSPDGITWTSRNGPISSSISVVWAATAPNGSGGQGLFVAVGGGYGSTNGDQVATSPDGINWTGRIAASQQGWIDVTWGSTTPNGLGGQGLFVAVSDSNSTTNGVMTSPDGITWTLHASNTGGWNGVTWASTASNGSGGQGLFVAANSSAASSNGVMTSPDGVTWTLRNTAGITNNWYDVTWAANAPNGSGGQGLFVLVGASSGNGREVETSPNGVTWTFRSESFDANYAENYVSVVWSPTVGIFVAFNYTNNNEYISSSDGVTWTQHTAPNAPLPVDSAWSSVVWAATAPNGLGGQGLFVAVASSSAPITNQVMTSPDGNNWTARTAAALNNWTSVTWSPDLSLFAAVASSGTGTRVMTSPDGINWTTQTSAYDEPWNSIVWSHELHLFVAVGETSTGNGIMTSSDGATWTIRHNPINSTWSSVTWSPSLSLFVAVASASGGGGNRVMTSPDGTNWTAQTASALNNWTSVTWSPDLNLFAAVASSGTSTRVMTSSNGVNWTTRTNPVDNNWMSVVWSPSLSLFVAVGNNGGVNTQNTVMTSPDGTNWTVSTNAPAIWWKSVTWSPELGIIVAVANYGLNSLSNASLADMAMSSPTSPIIGSTTATSTSISATVTWNTDEAATSQVQYGLTSSYGSSTTLDSSLITNHSVSISGLTCNTTYHFQTISSYAGYSTFSSDYTFTTTSGACNSTPTVTASAASNITQTSATLNGSITVTGGENATTQGFNWGLTSLYGNTTTATGTFGVGTFTTDLSGLFCNTVYHYQAYAINSIGTGASSPDLTFTTSACTSAVQTWTSVDTTNVGEPTGYSWSSIAWSAKNNIFVSVSQGAGGHIASSPDAVNWTNNPATIGTSWYSVIWAASAPNGDGLGGTGLFVAVGSTADVATSPDGLNWTVHSNVVAGTSWKSVVWAPEKNLFVAVANLGTGHRVMTSSDGVTWTLGNTPADNNWATITWSPTANPTATTTGMFVAGALSGTSRIMTSPDGFNWTLRTPSAFGWVSVAWSPQKNLFAAVSFGGQSNGIITSTSGTVWTNRTSAATNQWNSIVWSPTAVDPTTHISGMFVATAGTGIGTRVMTSADGVTWVSHRAAVDIAWVSVTWSPEKNLFVAVSSATQGANIMTSPDGTNWTLQTDAVGVNQEQWVSTTWSPTLGLFSAVSYSSTGGHSVMTSPDGTNWTVRNPGSTNYFWSSITWAQTSSSTGLFVAVASSDTGANNRVMTSPDGINWTFHNAAATNQWTSVAYSPDLNLFVAVSSNGSANRAMSSTDGSTWTIQTTPNNSWSSVVWSHELGLFVAVGSTGSGADVMTSSNGTTWNSGTGIPINSWTSVTWSPALNLFVAVANSGTGNRVMTSSDGITWTSRTSYADNAWSSVVWSPEAGQFVAVAASGSGNLVMSSNNGINWTGQTQAASNQWNSVTWSPSLGLFAAVASTGTSTRVMISAPTLPHSVVATSTASTATITWVTDQAATSQVRYGLTSGYTASTTIDSSLVMNHTVTFGGLACGGTTYHYSIVSTIGSLTSSSVDATFTTLACPTVSIVDTTDATNITTTTATLNGDITATGGENPATRGFNYGLTSSYTASTTASGSFSVGSFTASLSGLTCGTTYHFQSYATNSAGTGTSTDATFTTSSCPIVIISSGGGGISVTRRSSAHPPIITAVKATPNHFIFTKSYKLGDNNPEIKQLQIFLNTHGFVIATSGAGSKGKENNYFGAKTRSALTKFQKANSIKPSIGFFGPVTISAVNKIILNDK